MDVAQPHLDTEIIGKSTFISQGILKQEASIESSKDVVLKIDDRVKFIGNFSSISSLQNYPDRGPSYGLRGKILLALEDNGSPKIGFRLRKSIPNGNDLGGLCEGYHGFFCCTNHLP